MSKFQLTPVTGLPQVDGWAQVISHPSGSFFCVLAVQGQNANSIGKNLTEFLLSQEINTSASLHHVLLDLLQKARAELCKIQLACLTIGEKNKVIAATHSGSVLLKRNGKIGEILFSTGELKIIEGVLQDGDLFSIATEEAKDTFSNLKEKLANKTEEIATKLVSELQDNQTSSLVAVGLLEETIIEVDSTTKKVNRKVFKEKLANLINYSRKVNLKNLFLVPKKISTKINFSKEKVTLEQQNNLQLFLKIAFFLITVFVAIIFWKQQAIKKELEPITPVLENIDQRFEQLKNNDRTSQLELRTESRNLLKELEDLITQNKDNKYSLEAIKKQYQEIQAFSETISGVETQGPLDPFFDLRLAEPEFIEKQTSLDGQQLFALDAAGEYGIYLDLTNKQTTKFDLGKVEVSTKAIAIGENSLFALGNGIHVFNLTDPEKHQQLKEEGDSDRGGTIIKAYGPYIYIFNPEKRNIYRYLLKDEELSEPIGWLIDKQDLDFSAVESMAVDGDLWLTDNNGQIFKYTQGQKQDFTIKDLPTTLGKTIKIAASENNDYLYILDKDQQKVVILQKDGQFVKEISSESLSSGGNIVALTDKPGALVISGSLIYQLFP
ncbi:MAG: hypothetical protein ACOZAK_04090 [Patescibacteria group bacterium]